MSDDLLAKETEFHRLNRELQLKAHDIIKEVDSIIHARDSNNLFCNNDTNQLHSAKTIQPKNRTSKVNKQSKESLTKISKIPSMEDINDSEISSKRNYGLGNKAIINLLQGKIDMLHKELQAVQLEYNKKCDYSKVLEMENKKLDDTRIKLCNQIVSLNDIITRLESTNSDILLKYQALKNESITLKKDFDSLKKEMKIFTQQSISYDTRLNKSVESNEKLRNALKCSQIEEKELRNQIRKLQEDKRLTIKNLEKQRSELVQVFKKQVLLIDNLKKQNIYLMANGQIHLIEEDFAKLLDWKPQQL